MGRIFWQTQEHIFFLEGETPNGAKRQGRFTARPAEKRAPGTEINYFQKQQRKGAHLFKR
jgi:hypothetical protein